MSIAAKKVWFDERNMFVEFMDGQVVETPVSNYRNLSKGTPEQWAKVELWSDGEWLHWEDLNEDLGAEGILRDAKIEA